MVAVAGALACGRSAPPRTGVAPAACMVAPAPAEAPDSLRVGITATAEPNRIFSQPNIAERFLLAHAYETLLRMDCSGTLQPGVAASWSYDSTAGRVRVVLRRGVRFWNGTAVTARDVLEGWRLSNGTPVAAAIAQASTVVDDTTLAIGLAGFDLAALADRELVVRRDGVGTRWAEGTGPYRIEEIASAPAARSFARLRLGPTRGGAPSLTILIASPARGRDLVDEGADLLLTDVADIGAYAARYPDLSPVAVPWNRTWVVLLPSGSMAAGTTRPPIDHALLDVAHDAVPGSARPAEPPYWWQELASCPRRATPARTPPSRRTSVAYRETDIVGRAVAERLVALERTRPLKAEALAASDFADALSNGIEVGFVLDVPRRAVSPCASVARFERTAPWLAAQPWEHFVFPVVDSHDYVFVRAGRIGLVMAWDGTPVVAGVVRPQARP